MIVGLVISIMLAVSAAGGFPVEDLPIKLKTDPALVVPGFGAEGAVLKESMVELTGRLGHPDRVVKNKHPRELFSEIFAQAIPLKIPFDTILYYESKRCIFFIASGKVAAIAGFSKNRVTIDSISLNNGVEYVLFHYGNEGLYMKEKGKSRLYVYAPLGIALADDGADNEVDIFIVFEPRPAAASSRVKNPSAGNR